jgi:hypothetical protein
MARSCSSSTILITPQRTWVGFQTKRLLTIFALPRHFRDLTEHCSSVFEAFKDYEV